MANIAVFLMNRCKTSGVKVPFYDVWKLYFHTMIWHIIIPCFVCQYHLFMSSILPISSNNVVFHMLLGIANSSISSSYHSAFFVLTFPSFSSWNEDILDMCLIKETLIANIIQRIISCIIIIWNIPKFKHWIEHPLDSRNMILEYECQPWTFWCKMSGDDT